MTKWLTCQRSYYYRYICGITKTRVGDALRFGTAWHKAMEMRAKKHGFDECYAAAITGTEIEEYTAAMMYGMLKAYFEMYDDSSFALQPEEEFALPIKGARRFISAGKLDGIGYDVNSDLTIFEHKTTSDSVEPQSSYWERLRWNIQMLHYIWACITLIGKPARVIYDVVKKPVIKAKMIPQLDNDGLKIVVSKTTGARCYKRDGQPYQSSGTDMELAQRMETPEEYARRVYEDIKSRPEFYFARREMSVLDDDVLSFESARLSIVRAIMAAEKLSKRMGVEAYPRNCATWTCRTCDYSMFCMSNVIANPDCLPEGYELKRAHIELEIVQEQE